MTKTSSLMAAVVTSLAVQGATAAPVKTADQQLVAGLKTARAASRTALKSISPVSQTGAKKAETELSRAIKGMAAANNVAARAVGALATPSVRRVVRQGGTLAKRARSDVARGRYAAARVKLHRADALMSAALSDFGVPLEKDFPAFVTGTPGRTQFSAYEGISALVGRDITEVVIGAADRRTANAGEPGAASGKTGGLPITEIGPAFLVEASGQYTTNHCLLTSGLITCRLYSPMPADRVFVMPFGPGLYRGTRILVKFRSPGGKRSYALATTG